MDIIKHINWIDVLALVLVLRIAYVSSQAGLTHELFPLIGNAVVLILSLHFYGLVGVIINKAAPIVPIQVANFISFTGIAIVLIIIYKLLNSLLEMVLTFELPAPVEKIGGLITGVLKAFVVVSLVLGILAMAPFPYLQKSIREKSLAGLSILRLGPAMYSKVSRFMPVLKLGPPAGSEAEMMDRLESDKRISYK
jgi:uncharacterized membrane protein required for colicin V production